MPLGTEIGIGPGDIVLDGNPASPPKKGHNPPSFRPMSIVAKLSPISSLFSFAVNVNEQRIIAFLTERCCYLNLRCKVRTQLR